MPWGIRLLREPLIERRHEIIFESPVVLSDGGEADILGSKGEVVQVVEVTLRAEQEGRPGAIRL